jgi:hypothetical protein
MWQKNYHIKHLQFRERKHFYAYYANQKFFKSRLVTKCSKLKLYGTVIRPIVTYASGTWVLKETIIQKLLVFERKILRRIFGLTKEILSKPSRCVNIKFYYNIVIYNNFFYITITLSLCYYIMAQIECYGNVQKFVVYDCIKIEFHTRKLNMENQNQWRTR